MNDNAPIPAEHRDRKAAVARLALQPKAENMDGDNFDQWLAKVSAAFPPDWRGSWGERSDQVAMFNCNYDPVAAAGQLIKLQQRETPRRGDTRPLRIRRCTGNREAWLLAALNPDGSESQAYCSYVTAHSLDALIERGRHLIAPGAKIELICE